MAPFNQIPNQNQPAGSGKETALCSLAMDIWFRNRAQEYCSPERPQHWKGVEVEGQVYFVHPITETERDVWVASAN